MWFLGHKHVKLFTLRFHWCALLTNRTDHGSWVWLTLQQQEILGTWKLVNHCNKVLGEGLHGTIILGKDGNMQKKKPITTNLSLAPHYAKQQFLKQSAKLQKPENKRLTTSYPSRRHGWWVTEIRMNIKWLEYHPTDHLNLQCLNLKWEACCIYPAIFWKSYKAYVPFSCTNHAKIITGR